MYACAAQVFLRHVFARHRLHHFRTGEEHIRSALHHQREVRQGGRIDRTAGAGAEDARNLRHHAGGHDVTLEYLGESAQSIDAFLDTCAARVVQAYARCAHFHGLVHDLADFFSHRFRQRTAVHGEVLCEDINQTAVYRAAAGHHAVSQVLFLLHAEVRATMQLEQIHFLEAAGSSSMSMRSRAVYLPLACCFSMAFSPPPIRALARSSTNSLIFSVWTLIICFIFCFKKKALIFLSPKKQATSGRLSWKAVPPVVSGSRTSLYMKFKDWIEIHLELC